jgi:uncharacterized protein (TIGR01244 family)
MSFASNKVSDDFYSAPQIAVDDLSVIASQGFKTVLNCRPDAEGDATQPASVKLKLVAEQLGLQYYHFPVVMGTEGAEHAAEAAKALAAAPKPVLGFCRSGGRATNFYQTVVKNK